MSVRLTDFRTADFEALVTVWRQFYPAKYHISEELLRRSTVDSPLFDWGASCIAYVGDNPVGFVAIKRAASRLYKCADPDAVHLNSIAFDTPDTGLDLLAYTKGVLTDRGHSKLVFGQDSDHLFPGCPVDVRMLGSFLLVEGFVGSDQVVDLERDLGDYQNPSKPVKGAEFCVLTKKDLPALDKFLQTTFPGRWHFDTMQKVSAEGIESCVFGLVIKGEIKGFAMIQSFGQKRPVNGAIWNQALGENWGALGAIGVASEVRGKGFGNALLGAALENLKARGVRKCIIDWTGLVEFYGKHGFEVTRTYDSLALSLESY